MNAASGIGEGVEDALVGAYNKYQEALVSCTTLESDGRGWEVRRSMRAHKFPWVDAFGLQRCCY